jgi:hypothetical protein
MHQSGENGEEREEYYREYKGDIEEGTQEEHYILEPDNTRSTSLEKPHLLIQQITKSTAFERRKRYDCRRVETLDCAG